MKHLFSAILLIMIGFPVFSQPVSADKVPKDVMDRLHHAFPQSMDIPVTWVKEKGDYKASLTIMDSPAFVVIDSTGKQKRLERKINPVYLPDGAKIHLKKIDPKHEVISVMKIVDDKDRVTYKATAKIITSYTFDADGKVMPAK